MTDKNKEIIVRRKGKKTIKVKGKKLAKKLEKKPKYCPNCGSSMSGTSCAMCGAKLEK